MNIEHGHSTYDAEQISTHTPGRSSSRNKSGTHFGDEDFTLTEIDEFDEAEWGEVFRACCLRSPVEWRDAIIGLAVVIFLTYFYIFSLLLFGAGAKALSGCRVGELFSEGAAEINPLSGVMLGCLATALIQSSSTTTAIIVTLVGAKTINVENATFLIMGANIGTTLTNDIVAIAMMKDVKNLERAFAGAVLHDLFNILTVGILLPLEAATGYLQVVTKLIVDGAETRNGSEFDGPVEVWVKPLLKKLINANSKAILIVSQGKSCDALYPTHCEDGIVDYDSCKDHVGFIKCDKSTNDCPAFFLDGAELKNDQVAGGVCVVLGLLFMFICVFGLTITVQYLLRGFSTRVVHKATNYNGYINIALGAGLTMLLQSSSLTTSILTPLVGIGVLRLEHMLPLTLGTNIGTTLSSVMVALVSPGLDPLQVALIHLFFNLTGVLIWYPIPNMRKLIIFASQKVGYCARVFRLFPALFIVVVYFVGPVILLSLSNLFMFATVGELASAIVITVILGLFIISMVYFCRYLNGGSKMEHFVKRYLTFSSWGNRNNDNSENNPRDTDLNDSISLTNLMENEQLNRTNTRPDEDEDSEESSTNSSEQTP